MNTLYPNASCKICGGTGLHVLKPTVHKVKYRLNYCRCLTNRLKTRKLIEAHSIAEGARRTYVLDVEDEIILKKKAGKRT